MRIRSYEVLCLASLGSYLLVPVDRICAKSAEDTMQLELRDTVPVASQALLSLVPTLEVDGSQTPDQAFTFTINLLNKSREDITIGNPIDRFRVKIKDERGRWNYLPPETPRFLIKSGSGKHLPRSFKVIEIRSNGQVRTEADSEPEWIKIAGQTKYQVRVQFAQLLKNPENRQLREWERIEPGEYQVRVFFILNTRGLESDLFRIKVTQP